ncbi:hypothetical protein J21TS7_49470 [Paenibacillus cineris]|uniref:Uncharacterized protein n=1 Tax=Paenibacillus cineris TaxID=237530 RepID=A0ABQ4LJC2_9BACL|nr:hypothetical protein J21TS7_49470 [Paenibacillus cineris]
MSRSGRNNRNTWAKDHYSLRKTSQAPFRVPAGFGVIHDRYGKTLVCAVPTLHYLAHDLAGIFQRPRVLVFGHAPGKPSLGGHLD